MIEGGCSKGTCNNTCLAADAFIPINEYPLIFKILVACLCGTYLHTEGLLAVLACHGEVEPDILPFNHPDSRSAGVAGSGVEDGADHFTLATPCALLMIDHQYLPLHHLPPSLTLVFILGTSPKPGPESWLSEDKAKRSATPSHTWDNSPSPHPEKAKNAQNNANTSPPHLASPSPSINDPTS